MGRRLRHFCPNTFYLLTNTVTENQARFELTPEVHAVIEGLLFKYAHVYGIELANFVFTRHYFKILAKSPTLNFHQFMGNFQGNLSRVLNKLQERTGSVLFSKRFQATPVHQDAHEEVFRDILQTPVTDGLVQHPNEWPGVSAWGALSQERDHEEVCEVSAKWTNSTDYWPLRRNPEQDEFDDDEVRELAATNYRVTLAKLPVWKDLSARDYAQKVRDMGAKIAEKVFKSSKAELDISATSRDEDVENSLSAGGNNGGDIGDEGDQAPTNTPADNADTTIKTKNLPPTHELITCPATHRCPPWKPIYDGVCITFDQKIRQQVQEEVHDREAQYDRAALRLREGKTNVYFPEGMIPPGHLYCVGSPDAVRTGQNPIAPQPVDEVDAVETHVVETEAVEAISG